MKHDEELEAWDKFYGSTNGQLCRDISTLGGGVIGLNRMEARLRAAFRAGAKAEREARKKRGKNIGGPGVGVNPIRMDRNRQEREANPSAGGGQGGHA